MGRAEIVQTVNHAVLNDTAYTTNIIFICFPEIFSRKYQNKTSTLTGNGRLHGVKIYGNFKEQADGKQEKCQIRDPYSLETYSVEPIPNLSVVLGF